jgi:hypothetical protein
MQINDHDPRNDSSPAPPNAWIGTVLAALGEHIRRLEDENRDLRYALKSHGAFREYDEVRHRAPSASTGPGVLSAHQGEER